MSDSTKKAVFTITEEIIDKLFLEAVKARKNSYAPYSFYKVGASVLTDDGTIFSGANVENAVYGETICAERSAIIKTVNSGYRKIIALAVVANPMKNGMLVRPCGSCLQVVSEFSENPSILLGDSKANRREITNLNTLFPQPFKLKKIEKSE